MRIFNIQNDGKFEEFSKTYFHVHHDEQTLEKWFETNPNEILEDGGLLIIGRQVTINLGSVIDLLGVDKEGNTVVIELKRGRTPRETLSQALEYASFVEKLDTNQLEKIFLQYVNGEILNLVSYHRNYFELTEDDAVAFNKEQRIVIAGQKITGDIRQTAGFLREKGIRVTCLEFSYFQSTTGQYLLSYDVVVGKESPILKDFSSSALPKVSRTSFLSALDDNGRMLFEQLLRMADEKDYPIHWGSKGFSMNVDKNGTHVAVCYGYPPNSVYK